MQKPVLLFLASLIGVSLAGCANLMDTTEPAKPVKPQAPADTAKVEEIHYAEFDPEVLYLLLSAEVAGQRGRYDITLLHYIKAAQRSRDKGVIRRALRIAQSLNGDNAQQQMASLWLEVEPDSLEAHRVLAIQAVKRSQLDRALNHMEQIMGLGGDADFDSLAAMASQLSPDKQQELLGLYRQLAERHPDNIEIEYSIALLLKINDQPATALERLTPLLEAHPNFQPAIILKGDLLYQTGLKTAALDYLLQHTRKFPGNRQMGTLYGRMLVGEGEMRAAQDEFARLVQQFPDVPGLRLSHALVAVENGELDTARQDLIGLIEQGDHENEAHFYLGKIADMENHPQQAIGYYEQVEEGPQYFPALSRASVLRAEAGDVDGALANIRQLRATNPQQSENFWLLEINLLLEQGRTDKAFDSANQALTEIPDSVRIRYARAMLLDGMARTEEAEADLRRVLDAEPNNSVALNALGYILATRTDRLEEAEALISRALEIDPSNPAILDSMGWVLFRQERFEPALTYLKQAYEAFPDPEVAAHFGELLWRIGEQEQARIVWRSALDDNPNHPILRETVLRLTGEQEL
ncbi:MAG: tetratricopeptide repeat protein [Marinobacter sp.]|uniref:tetratricopeptide repeat protein n=1 Tax=Marinobacter sp. TaxID=50741 RepID=UPI00299D7397|nr:tetratricopeptide repeat protein [Marinobacter sp.]MDX1755902.1 tetratricopeptide repeat protein [Marinobacter sp.]